MFLNIFLVNYTPLQRGSEGFSEPLGIENPRSSIDVTKLRLVKSTDDGEPISSSIYFSCVKI